MAQWSIEIAEGWQQTEEDGTVTVFHFDGVGALQIIAFEADDAITPEDIQRLSDEAGPQEAEYSPRRCGEFEGIAAEHDDGEEWWRFWFVAAGTIALAIAYNCDKDDRRKETETVDTMLATLTLGAPEE